MNYEQLTDEAKETIKTMVEFCVQRAYCMGQDEGIKIFADGGTPEVKHDFRNELEMFCGLQISEANMNTEMNGSISLDTINFAHTGIAPVNGKHQELLELSTDDNSSEQKLTSMGAGLLEVFRYIEGVRGYGVNIKGKRRLPKGKNADLFFAGKQIIDLINEHGNLTDMARLQAKIDELSTMFKVDK